jgi:hypothetical protein
MQLPSINSMCKGQRLVSSKVRSPAARSSDLRSFFRHPEFHGVSTGPSDKRVLIKRSVVSRVPGMVPRHGRKSSAISASHVY